MDAQITGRRPHLELLPGATRRPAHRPGEATALREYLTTTKTFSRQPVALSAQITTAAWLLVLTLSGLSTWLISEVRGPGECTTRACRLATLGGHPLTTLLLCATSLSLLLALALVTRGLRRAGSIELTLLLAAAVLGFVTCLGAALVVLLALLAGALLLGVLFLVLAAIGRRT